MLTPSKNGSRSDFWAAGGCKVGVTLGNRSDLDPHQQVPNTGRRPVRFPSRGQDSSTLQPSRDRSEGPEAGIAELFDYRINASCKFVCDSGPRFRGPFWLRVPKFDPSRLCRSKGGLRSLRNLPGLLLSHRREYVQLEWRSIWPVGSDERDPGLHQVGYERDVACETVKLGDDQHSASTASRVERLG